MDCNAILPCIQSFRSEFLNIGEISRDDMSPGIISPDMLRYLRVCDTGAEGVAEDTDRTLEGYGSIRSWMEASGISTGACRSLAQAHQVVTLTNMSMCMHVCMSVCKPVCVVHVYMYACMYIYIYVYNAYIIICMHTHTHTFAPGGFQVKLHLHAFVYTGILIRSRRRSYCGDLKPKPSTLNP